MNYGIKTLGRQVLCQARKQETWALNLLVLHIVLASFFSLKLCILICTESHFAFPNDRMERKYPMESLQGPWVTLVSSDPSTLFDYTRPAFTCFIPIYFGDSK